MNPCTVAAFLLALAGAPSPEPAPRASLSELRWMAGEWVDEQGGNLSEEIWAAPAGDSMMGMWRLVSGGKVKLFEFLTLVEEEQGPVFRLRHFDRKGIGWEEKDQPRVLPLVRSAPREAVFEGQSSEGGLLRLTYRRPAEDRMEVLLEMGTQKQSFRFRKR